MAAMLGRSKEKWSAWAKFETFDRDINKQKNNKYYHGPKNIKVFSLFFLFWRGEESVFS